MKLPSGIFIICIFLLFSCSLGNNKLSISALKFNYQYSNKIDLHKPCFDTLQSFISFYKPDLIIFKETVFTKACIFAIESKGYSFIPVYTSGMDSSLFLTPIIIKNAAFDVLGGSYYVYENDSLLFSKNMLEWFELKSKSSGHVFYVFNLQLQSILNMYQSEIIAYDLLQRIDQLSAGLPVLLLGDFNKENEIVKKLLTDNWLNIFPLREIRSDINSDFLVNDFFKVINSYSEESSDSLMNNLVIKFFINSQNITKSKTGKLLPTLN